jgi:hypothetical protein
MEDNEIIDKMIQNLIAAGAIEIEGVDSETGEFLYKITSKMQQVNKELYDAHLNTIHSDTMYFWEKGFVDIDDITSNNPIIYLNKRAFDKQALDELPSDKIPVLNSLIKALERRN